MVLFIPILNHWFRDTCSWKGELEKKKLETFKLESQKFESFCLSWKEPSKVGKKRAKLETSKSKWIWDTTSVTAFQLRWLFPT